MPEMLRLAALSSDGVFTARQALDHGVSPKVLRRLVADGVCDKLRRGLYVFNDPADLMSRKDGAERSHARLARAILRQHPELLAASHHTAAILAGLPVWGVEFGRPRFVRVEHAHTTSQPDLSIGRPWPADALIRTGDGCTVKPAVAALQIAMSSGLEQAVVTLDAALARNVTTPDELQDWLVRISGNRNCTRARAAVEFADARSESVGESRLRLRLHHLGYAGLEPQVNITARGRFLGRVDLFDQEHQLAIEFDGLEKYEGPDGQRILADEKKREDLLRSHGVGVVRYCWEHLDRPAVLRERMDRGRRASRDYGERSESRRTA